MAPDKSETETPDPEPDPAPNLILASASPARARLLAAAGLGFAARPARIDEEAIRRAMEAEAAAPADIAATLARAKALRVSRAFPGRLVLGADQVLVAGDRLFAKAETLTGARAVLQALRGREHRLISALVAVRDGAEIWRHVAAATLHMRAFSDHFLDSYLKAEGPAILGAVGCYHLEGRGVHLFDRIEGDYFTVLGLPLLPLLTWLRQTGELPA